MSEWQDINTAPKDGTFILILSPPFCEGGRHIIRIGSFRIDDGFSGNKEPLFLGDDYNDFSTGYASTPLRNATHWMPLPEPPK